MSKLMSSSKGQASSLLFFSRGSERGSSANQQLCRKRPNKTELDSEKLFQQSLKLNSELGRLAQQNQQMKALFDKVDQTRTYKQELIFEVQNIIKEKSRELNSENKASSWLVYNLKKKINTMNRDLKDRQSEIDQFDNCKIALVLKQKEVQADSLKALAEAHMLDQHDLESNDVLDQLVEVRMHQQIQEQHIQQLQANIQGQQRKIRQIQCQTATKRTEIGLRNQEQERRRKLQQIRQLKEQMERLNLESEEVRENSEKVQEMEATRDLKAEQIQDLKSRIRKIVDRQNLQKKQLQTKIQLLQDRLQQRSGISKVTTIILDNPKECPVPVEDSKQKKPYPLVGELKLADVESIGQQLRYSLSLKRVNHKKWKQFIISGVEEETISIGQLAQILEQQPFGLKPQSGSIKLSRYLVEQVSGKHMFDPSVRQAIPIVKSILEKLIGCIISYTASEQEKLQQQISAVTQKYNMLIVSGFKTKAPKQSFVSLADLIHVLDACALDFTNQQLQFITLYLFSFSESLDKLLYANICKLGSQELIYR